VLIGEPGREYGWILSRTPALDKSTLDGILDRAVALGYDRAAFRLTPQTQPLD
jgi:apolipoprotein D and lipocalin family protein